jgi:hypothetical protein
MTDKPRERQRLPHLRPSIAIDRMQAAVLAVMRRHARLDRGSLTMRDRDTPERRKMT